MNPILPMQYFIPDVEARQWSDGRMYLYGSSDIGGNTLYCSQEYRVFSSDDILHWTDHGVSFSSADVHSNPAAQLYAPDCLALNGRYYLCYCCSDGSEGIAVSDSPYGPFKEAWGVQGADGDGIDPAILLDDDGQVYYFWGQHHLRGARLTPDLKAIDRATLHTHLLIEDRDGFHEGASIRKRNGLYYLVYTDISRGRATCMSYATSRSPLGPFEKRGVLIDNTGCDPETWNNHGSIAKFNGQWYLFYHRSSQASRFNRRVCVEPIEFDAEGGIATVEMTTQGISGPLDATRPIEAWRACLLSGQVRTESLPPDAWCDHWREHLTVIHNGDWAAYKYLDFGPGVALFRARVGSLTAGGRIEVHIDQPDGPLLAVCEAPHTGGWNRWTTVSARLQRPVADVHAVYLAFGGPGGRLFNLERFEFARDV
ncbi:MAG TPA: family 43 glycosylhydrolase [Anaerolineae bacterium]|nr:family 43 glycosylhydrolase [Anaerolineae bacterium]HQI85620.1 family 43 glycosylhydrolase [Anaerolineae bacterium]